MKRKFLFIDYDCLIKNLTKKKTQWDKILLRKKEYSQENPNVEYTFTKVILVRKIYLLKSGKVCETIFLNEWKWVRDNIPK